MSDERIFRSGQKPPAPSKQPAILTKQEGSIPDLRVDNSKSEEGDWLNLGFFVSNRRNMGNCYIFINFICLHWCHGRLETRYYRKINATTNFHFSSYKTNRVYHQ